jgi:hypothetical protein
MKTEKSNQKKLGINAKRASFLYRNSKKQWNSILKQEIREEKSKRKPAMPNAAKRASKRYAKVRMTWQQALKKVSSHKES